MYVCTQYQLDKVADIGTLQRLPRVIGYQQSLELAYTGRYNVYCK